MLGMVVKNKYGNEELKVKDEKGGHVTIIKYPEDVRYCSGEIGMVASYTADGVGGTEILRTVEDIDKNMEAIKRINRLTDCQKEVLLDFLLDIRKSLA